MQTRDLSNVIDTLDRIRDLKRELGKIDLRARKRELIWLREALKGTPSAISRDRFSTEPLAEPTQRTPVWKWIKAVLQDADRPLSVPEIYERLVVRGHNIAGARPKDMLRISMLRKPEEFAKIGESFSLAMNQINPAKAKGATEVAP
jgi:hypothetical protein